MRPFSQTKLIHFLGVVLLAATFLAGLLAAVFLAGLAAFLAGLAAFLAAAGLLAACFFGAVLAIKSKKLMINICPFDWSFPYMKK